MTEISSIIRGIGEESDPLKPCKVCGVLPTLEIIIGPFPDTGFLFSCPECGTESVYSYGIRMAKRYWNEGPASKIITERRQKKVDDF